MISIIIPAYNEREGISGVLEEVRSASSKLKAMKEESEIIVVDDGSTDGTREILGREKGIRVIKHSRNRGYGAALKTGIRASKGDWILITDADGTYPNADIPRLVKEKDGCDMVVGSRTGTEVRVPFFRKPAKAMLGVLANYMARTKIPDLNSGMRLFRKDVAERFFNIFPDGFSFTTTITMACFCNGYDVKYVPINYMKRKGKSTIKPKEFANFILLIIRVVSYFDPLRFFVPMSLLLFALAMLVTGYSVFVLGQLMDVTVSVLLIASLQTAFLGIIADMISKKR